MTYESAVASSWTTMVRERRSRYGRDGSRKPRVLLVDDDPVNRSVAVRALRKQFAVTAVASAEEALARFEPGAFDIVLTDHRMAAMTGIELLEQIRMLEPRVRRVLMSGTTVSGLTGYLGSGIVERFLVKPADLRSALAELIGLDDPKGKN